MKPYKQKITIRNDSRGTRHMLLLNRQSGRLSKRQERETFQALAVPGYRPAGVLGEYPFEQDPIEYRGVNYVVVRMGEPTDTLSNLYFVPVEAAKILVARHGAEYTGSGIGPAEIEEEVVATA